MINMSFGKRDWIKEVRMLHTKVAKLESEIISLKDQLRWSLKNEEQYKKRIAEMTNEQRASPRF